mgnify:CR=1 FL=1
MPVNLPLPRREELFPVAGVELGWAEARIRKANRKDVLVVRIANGASVDGVFTRNRFCAAPVTVCREHLAAGAGVRALVVNTGNAIAESDETDNSYSRSFYVGGGIPGQIAGTIWHDLNEDAQITGGEPKLDGWRAFVDVDEDGVYDAGEPSTTTDASGVPDGR